MWVKAIVALAFAASVYSVYASEPPRAAVSISFEGLEHPTTADSRLLFKLTNQSRWRIHLFGIRGPGTSCPGGESYFSYYLEKQGARAVPEDVREKVVKAGGNPDGPLNQMLLPMESHVVVEQNNRTDAVHADEPCFLLPRKSVTFRVPVARAKAKSRLFVMFAFEWDLRDSTTEHRSYFNLTGLPKEVRGLLVEDTD